MRKSAATANDRTAGEGALHIWRRCRYLVLLPAGLLPLCGTTVDAANNPAPGDNRPIAVTAQSGIEWQKQAQVYIARGNAVATRGTTEVHADTLTAHYRPAKGAEGGNEVYRLDADGHVVITNRTDTVVGDRAVYDVGQQIAVITGKDLKLTTPTDVVTARDTFEWYDQQQIAVARGDAVATRGDRRIRADVLTARLIKEAAADAGKPGTAAAAKPAAAPGNSAAAAAKRGPASTPNSGPVAAVATKPGGAATATLPAVAPTKPSGAAGNSAGTPADALGNSRISRIDAQGNVIVSTPSDIGRGNFGVYNAITGIVTLLGNVTITRGQNIVRGQYAVVDLNTNVSRMISLPAEPGKPAPRVEGVFVRQQPTGGPAASGRPAAPAAEQKP